MNKLYAEPAGLFQVSWKGFPGACFCQLTVLARGRVTRATQTIRGQSFTVGNSADQSTSMTYPAGEVPVWVGRSPSPLMAANAILYRLFFLWMVVGAFDPRDL